MPNRNNVTTESFRNIFIGFKSTHKHFLIFSNWVQDPDVKLVGDKTPMDQAEDIYSGQESCSLMIISNVSRALQLCTTTDKRFLGKEFYIIPHVSTAFLVA